MSIGPVEPTVENVFEAIAGLTPQIRSNLVGRRGAEAGENPSGETRLAADEHADDLLFDRLREIDGVGAIASEERETPEDLGDGVSITLDPLDGSSNLASNNAMGTIVGIYDESLPASGASMVAAAYVLYGPITTMVTAVDGTVTEYELVNGERRVATEELTVPDDPVVYGFGGGDDSWTEPFAAYVEEIRQELKLRYGGAMVGDVNQVLTYGGIFAYPALQSRPEGKLRLQFEGNPMAYIVEAAGGASSDGDGSILDREVDGLHDRTPVHLGNEELIDRLEGALE